jgi:hypothetical protein
MDEAVHVGRVQVGLLVPRGRRQDDVRVERRRVHAEVQVDDQVHLALRRGLVPDSISLDGSFGHVLGDRVVVRAEIVRRKYSWPLELAIRALPRQMNQTRGQFSGASGSSTENRSFFSFSCSTVRAHHFLVGLGAGCLRASLAPQRVLRELRIERQPAVADGADLHVHRVPLRESGSRLSAWAPCGSR